MELINNWLEEASVEELKQGLEEAEHEDEREIIRTQIDFRNNLISELA